MKLLREIISNIWQRATLIIASISIHNFPFREINWSVMLNLRSMMNLLHPIRVILWVTKKAMKLISASLIRILMAMIRSRHLRMIVSNILIVWIAMSLQSFMHFFIWRLVLSCCNYKPDFFLLFMLFIRTSSCFSRLLCKVNLLSEYNYILLK